MDQSVSDDIERTVLAERSVRLKCQIKRGDGLAIGKGPKELGNNFIWQAFTYGRGHGLAASGRGDG